jgi:lauroyl/myristoyl acyltransferase
LVEFATRPGHVTVALADEGCGVRWGTGTLLGRAASVGSTPFDLARRADLGLLPVFAVRMQSEHRLVVERPLKPNPDADPDRELDRLVGKWLKLVSAHARRRPSHYFPFLLDRRLRRDADPMPLFADAGA